MVRTLTFEKSFSGVVSTPRPCGGLGLGRSGQRDGQLLRQACTSGGAQTRNGFFLFIAHFSAFLDFKITNGSSMSSIRKHLRICQY